jgi:L-amino acid N-acyltransferase YncA
MPAGPVIEPLARAHCRLVALEDSAVLENEASLAPHRGAGFRVMGVRKRFGQMDGRWRDVLLLERRSRRI